MVIILNDFLIVPSFQILRSASDWSAGTPTEHSILNAYIEAISKAEHFIYIEVRVGPRPTLQNQFISIKQESVTRSFFFFNLVPCGVLEHMCPAYVV